MEKQLLKKSGIIAAIVTFVALAFWFGFAKISLGIYTSDWTKYGLKKDSVIDEQIIILAGTNGSRIVFGTTTGKWVGTPTDSTLASIGLNTGTGKFEIKNAGTDTASPIVKYHGDLSGVTANQHHAQVHGAADHSGSIGTESQITFGAGSGHAHTGTDSTKVNYPNLLNRSHGAADHSGNIGTESQITFGAGSGHAHTGTDSTKVSYPNLLNRSHGAADHTGNIGAESQITFGTGSGHAHNGIDSAKIDYDLAPVQLGTDTTGSSDNISEGSANKYYSEARFATSYNTKTKWKSLGIVGTGTLHIASTGDATHTVSYNPATGDGTVTVTISGGATAKANVQEGGTTTVSQAAHINFDNDDFDVSVDGAGAKIALTNTFPIIQLTGTTTTNPSVGNILFVEVGTSSTQIGTRTTIVVGTLTGGVVTDAGNNGNPGSNCFDGTLTTSYQKQGSPSWIKYNMGTGSSAAINTLTISSTPSVDPEGFQYLASNNDSSWTLLYSGTHTAGAYNWQTYTFSNETAYQFHKIDIIATSHPSDWRELGEIGFLRQTYPAIMDACTTYKLKYLDDNKNLRMSIYSPGTRTTEASKIALMGSTTLFGTTTELATSTTYIAQYNGGLLSNLGYYTLCFDSIKVITDGNIASLRSKYLDSFYDINVKESYARKGNMPLVDAANIAKRQYKQEHFETWKSTNIRLPKYYVDEFLPGSGTVQSFQIGAFETDYNTYIEEAWATDPARNNYIQEVKNEQDMDRTKKMLRPSLSDPSTPAIIKAGDGSSLSLDDTLALAVMAVQEMDERVRSATAEIEALKALINK